MVWLLATRDLSSWTGGFWHDRALRPVHYRRATNETAVERRALWDFCEAATRGLDSGRDGRE